MGNRELELKLTLDKGALDRLRRRPILRQLGIAPPKRRKLRSFYYDTPDLSLYRAKASLRVRRCGRQWVQTVKVGTDLQHGLASPLEVERPVRGCRPNFEAISDPVLKHKLAQIIANQPLRPVFETCVWRTTRTIQVADIGTIELALDRGEILVGDRSIEIQEVELELKSGDVGALLKAAEKLFAEDAFSISKQSKAQRGYAALIRANDDQVRSARPHSGRKPVLDPNMSGTDALCRLGRAASDQILQNWDAVQVCHDPEGPHQMRIGLRRLRTALQALKPVAKGRNLSWLANDGRRLGRVVGRLRDADVLLDDIFAPALAQIERDPRHSALCDVLIEHRDLQRVAVRESLVDPKWSRLRLNCMLFEHAVTMPYGHSKRSTKSDEIVLLARRALKKCWKRVRRWGRRLEKLSIVERHEMRKALKTLRYMTEFFLPLFAPAGSPSEAKSFLKQLKQLQNVFGYLNDVALADQMAGIVASTRPDHLDLMPAVKSIQTWHEDRADHAWLDAQRRWNNLAEAPRFWSRERLGDGLDVAPGPISA